MTATADLGFADRLAEHGDRLALVTPDGSLTYRELDQRVTAAAQYRGQVRSLVLFELCARIVATAGGAPDLEIIHHHEFPPVVRFQETPHQGERLPLDGRVARGSSEVNQAPITGESAPVLKQAGDEVFAGTINGDGALEVESTRLAEDTTLAHIIRMVEEAQSRKAPSEQWVERFARVYTPAVMGLALAVLLVWAFFAGESGAGGPERSYRVKPGDSLWSIAERTYAGDPREGVWELRERNGLDSTTIAPGQVLVVPS